jgi:quinohemoprotein ethanol dehydrogenase
MRFSSMLLAALAFAGAASAPADTVDNRLLSNELNGDDWAAYGRTFLSQHYSPLAQINDHNVSRLGLAWSFDLPQSSSVYGAPLAMDGILYFGVGYTVIRAMDAASGALLWTYDAKAAETAGHKLRAGWGIRGIALWQGKVFSGTQDGHLIALDAKSGRLLWSVQTTDPDDNRYINGVPFVFSGKVVVGHSGADLNPFRGYVTAYDANSGKQIWRFYTVPDDPAKKPASAAMAMAAKTWRGKWWRFGGGGGAVWNSMTYDPQFNRLYLGVGQGSPWNVPIRSEGQGDNLFLCSIVAVDADTGKYVWHYQLNPGDMWDYDAAEDIELTTLPISGRPQPVLMIASKNGFFYVLDRRSGKFVSANNFVRVTWADRIDAKTGRPVLNAQASYDGGGPTLVFPGPVGAHATAAMSFNPHTGLAYIPTTDLGFIYAAPPVDADKWQPKTGMQVNTGLGVRPSSLSVPPGRSFLVAWDPLNQKEAWSVPLRGISNGGTATTAGNLVFQGQGASGDFVAYAADDGRKLWSFEAQDGIQGQPTTYMAGGKQYVTVIAGFRAVGGFNDPSHTWDYRSQKRRVLTFTLDGSAKLPDAPAPYRPAFVLDEAFSVDPQKVAIGAEVIAGHCANCHGGRLEAGGTAPDLRTSAIPLSTEALTAVLHGALVVNGMPRFDELTPEEIEGIRHYIRQRARDSAAAAAKE